MTLPSSAFTSRMTALAGAMLALLCVVAPVWAVNAAAPETRTVSPAVPLLEASILASAPVFPTGGTFSYTTDVRLARPASYLQTVFQVFRPSGQLIFQRTRVANGVDSGVTSYSFSRELTGPVSLGTGDYPIRLSVSASINGSTVSTVTTDTMRVYDPHGPRVDVALVTRVTGQPMSAPDGRFELDPAVYTGARDAVRRIAHLVLDDRDAYVALAVPPVLLTEWRRLSQGYTLANGTAVQSSDPVAVAYGATILDLKTAIGTGRLELVSSGYSDPNLTDLGGHGLTRDVGPQYDAGMSAVFASLEMTASPGSVPAGWCVPPKQLAALADKGIRYVVVDANVARIGKTHPGSGAYPIAESDVTALLRDDHSAASLSLGDPTIAIARAFARLVREPKVPVVLGIDIDGDSHPETDSVGVAVSAIEEQPWLRLVGVADLKPAGSDQSVQLVAGKKTPDAPADFWKTVSKSRSYAGAYISALGPGDAEAAMANDQSLVAESASWSTNSWAAAPRGLAFANASLKTTRPVLDQVKLKIESLTLSGSTGKVPVSIVNDTQKTLHVTVRITTSGGVKGSGDQSIPTTLPPQETFLEIPVEVRSSLDGKLIVEVVAGELVLARQSAVIRSSYLDRLAIIGAIGLILSGLLVFIVRRVRKADAAGRYAEEPDGDADTGEPDTDETGRL